MRYSELDGGGGISEWLSVLFIGAVYYIIVRAFLFFKAKDDFLNKLHIGFSVGTGVLYAVFILVLLSKEGGGSVKSDLGIFLTLVQYFMTFVVFTFIAGFISIIAYGAYGMAYGLAHKHYFKDKQD